MLVWGEADGEEFTLLWGTLAVPCPGDLKAGAGGRRLAPSLFCPPPLPTSLQATLPTACY